MPELPQNTDTAPADQEEPRGDLANTAPSPKDEELLQKLREDYRYCLEYWRENRDEAAIDMQYAATNGWTTDDKAERANRPAVWPDELSQYVKQSNNNLRQNKRAIKVIPKGSGATDEDAENRAGIIRGIEYESGAQATYTTAYEQATWCGMGFFRLMTKEVGKNGEQCARIKRIPNQFTVLLDPDAKEADFSDARICFVTDTIRKSNFAKKYPKATKKSFSPEDAKMAPEWFSGENLLIAEYWVREQIDDDGDQWLVKQYITNGVEILEENEWAGSWIPVIPVLGEEIYTNESGSSKRVFLSLIRRARTPQKMLAYIASQEAEEFGMSPRVPFLGHKGTFSTQREAWKNLNKIAKAFMEFDIPTDWQPSWGPPPAPQRPSFVPNAEAYEMAYERWRRSLQAAMGLTPLPTAAQRQTEKSGIAIERIQTQEAIGSFHFTDNFDRALENAGRQLNELITKIYDTPRQVGIRDQKDEHAILHVAPEQHLDKLPKDLEGSDVDYLITDRGEFDVTISTGPSYQSQREEASSFVDTLLQNVGQLPLPPQVMQQVLGLAIKLKNIGPIGEEIAKLLAPPDPNNVPPEAQAAIQQAQGMVQGLQAELQKLQQEKQAKVVDNEYKKQIEDMRLQASVVARQMDGEIKLAIAEVSTQQQKNSERVEFIADLIQKMHIAAHERAMQAVDHAHEHSIADKQAQVAQAQQANQIQADQAAQQQNTAQGQ